MSDLALDCCTPGCPPEHVSVGGTTSISPFRTVLAGRFSHPDRTTIGTLLTAGTGSRKHLVAPADLEPCLDGQAMHLLLQDAVDVVLLDLDGQIGAMLSLVGKLRAAAHAQVVFVGILPSEAGSRASQYLSAVVDSVVELPLSACRLHAAIAEALQAAVDSQGGDYDQMLSGIQARH